MWLIVALYKNVISTKLRILVQTRQVNRYLVNLVSSSQLFYCRRLIQK